MTYMYIVFVDQLVPMAQWVVLKVKCLPSLVIPCGSIHTYIHACIHTTIFPSQQTLNELKSERDVMMNIIYKENSLSLPRLWHWGWPYTWRNRYASLFVTWNQEALTAQWRNLSSASRDQESHKHKYQNISVIEGDRGEMWKHGDRKSRIWSFPITQYRSNFNQQPLSLQENIFNTTNILDYIRKMDMV